MGVYYTARSIVGYRVTDMQRYDEGIVPNCAHNPPPEATFCPQCGKKVGTHSERKLRESWDAFQDAMQCRLPSGLQYEADFEYNDAFWIGYGSPSVPTGESAKIDIPDPVAVKADIHTLFEPYLSAGLFTFDENDFGLWTLHIGR